MTKYLLTILTIVFIALQLRLWIGPGSWAEVASLKKSIAEQGEINRRFKARNEVLTNEVEDLEHGLESIEERARSEFGLIKEGETFYRIVEDDKSD